MGRWEPNARGRLEQAALELYGLRGFDETTVKEIAQRAGLTERTFFRHFADKREVLFPSNALQDAFVAALDAVPESATPVDAMAAALEATTVLLQDRLEIVRRRQAIIDVHEELQARELTKLASIASALTDALHRRGVPAPAAALAAESGIVVFKVAFTRWISESNQQDFPALIQDTLNELKTVTAGK